MRDQMIALLCKPREIESSQQIVALKCLGPTVTSVTDVVLSRASLPFLNAFCTELGLGNEPVIFQTEPHGGGPQSNSLFWGMANILHRLHCGGFLVRWHFISLN